MISILKRFIHFCWENLLSCLEGFILIKRFFSFEFAYREGEANVKINLKFRSDFVLLILVNHWFHCYLIKAWFRVFTDFIFGNYVVSLLFLLIENESCRWPKFICIIVKNYFVKWRYKLIHKYRRHITHNLYAYR